MKEITMKTNNKNYISKLINITLGLCITLFSIGLSIIVVLNLTSVYKIAIEKFNIVNATGIPVEKLMDNYKGMVNYLANPFIEKLEFNDFAMSISGRVHFEEVKVIFMNLYIMMVTSILIIVILKSVKKISQYINFKKVLNYSANITLILFGAIATMIFIDFSKVFIIFHNIFFDNSYWIFDPVTDPIINALPEELFMIYAIIIIVILLLKCILLKFFYYKNKG